MNTKKVIKMKAELFFFFGLINLIIIVCTYFILPVIFNYPPFAENDLKFQNEVEQLNHPQQYIIIFLLLTVIFTIITNLLMHNIYVFLNHYYKKQTISDSERIKIRKDCINLPYLFYISEIIISFSLGILLVVSLGLSNTTMMKFGLLLITILPLISLLQFMYLQKKLKQIILLTYTTKETMKKINGIRIKFSTKLIIQIIPLSRHL